MPIPKPVAIAVLSALTLYGSNSPSCLTTKSPPRGTPSQATQQAGEWQDHRNEEQRRRGQADAEALRRDARRPREIRRAEARRVARGLLRRVP
jgi:hypothetical protein